MSRTKMLGVRKDFSEVVQSSVELVTVAKRQLSYWDYSRYSQNPVLTDEILRSFY